MGLVGSGIHRRHRDARLPARRRSDRRSGRRQRSGADLRRAHRNMIISLIMLALEAGLAVGADPGHAERRPAADLQATGPAIALCVALGFASIAKSRLLCKTLGAPVSGWRWDLAWAAAAGVVVGVPVRAVPARIAAAGRSASRRSSLRSARCCGPRASAPRTASCSDAQGTRSRELREAEDAADGARPDRRRRSSSAGSAACR